MAKHIIQTVEFIDDLDGSSVDEADIESISFSYKGSDYRIDLKPANAKKLDDALSKFIASAEKVSKRGSSLRSAARASSGSGRSKEELANIRDWAAKNGHEVSPRGRIAQPILEAYDEAHQS